MSGVSLPIILGAAGAIAAIVFDLPFVVAVCTLVACGATLLRLLGYFEALPEAG